jgi:hypothetical protein
VKILKAVGLVLVGLLVWHAVSVHWVEDWLWPNGPAPWEKVSAYYYPNKEDLTVARRQYGFSSVDECRNWVFGQAAAAGDPGLGRGDYECGVGLIRREHIAGTDYLDVTRLTIR